MSAPVLRRHAECTPCTGHDLLPLSLSFCPPQVGQPLPAPIPKAELAADYLVLPCAIVRGALAGLGLEASVTADATSMPQVDFTVVVRQAPAR